MSLFPFGRKLEAGRGYSFTEIPLFSTLSPAEIRLIEKKTRLVEFKRGDLVYEEGGPADAFYVIVSGRFRVLQKVRGEEDKTLAYLYRGDYFGESSLLTGQAHSASVEARSDGLLLRLDKEDFLKTLSQIPALSLHLSRTLGHRLTKIEGSGRKKQEVKVAAIYASVPAPESFQWVLDLATSLVRETKSRVILIDFVPLSNSGIPGDFHPKPSAALPLNKVAPTRESDLKPPLVDCAAGFQYLPVSLEKGTEGERNLSALLTFLSYRFDFLLIRLGQDVTDPSFRALKHSDMIYLLLDASTGGIPRSSLFVKELEQTFGFTKNEIKVLVPEGSETGSLKIFQSLPSRSEDSERYHAALRFITKELAGTLIGLVLGSGAAYGLSHIGVLRVLEKENIPIDVLAGSSMGAFVAAFWAAGFRANDLERIALSLDRRTAFFKLVGLGDLSIAHRGFFHGRGVTRFMESFLADKTFQDLQVPVKVVASSLTSSQQVIFETGRVVDALRASISIPGIFRPYHWKGELLIDGGILNPLPVDVLAKMGVKKIIAVNVLMGPEDRIQKTRVHAEKKRRLYKERAKNRFWRMFLAPILNKLSGHFSDNIFNVIMNTIQFMEYEIAEVAAQEADVLIEPVVHEGHWAEFYQAKKFIQAGEQKTQEQIDEIKQLIVE